MERAHIRVEGRKDISPKTFTPCVFQTASDLERTAVREARCWSPRGVNVYVEWTTSDAFGGAAGKRREQPS
jgi:hypothetical protein